jgi:hypothetical protein
VGIGVAGGYDGAGGLTLYSRLERVVVAVDDGGLEELVEEGSVVDGRVEYVSVYVGTTEVEVGVGEGGGIDACCNLRLHEIRLRWCSVNLPQSVEGVAADVVEFAGEACVDLALDANVPAVAGGHLEIRVNDDGLEIISIGDGG